MPFMLEHFTSVKAFFMLSCISDFLIVYLFLRFSYSLTVLMTGIGVYAVTEVNSSHSQKAVVHKIRGTLRAFHLHPHADPSGGDACLPERARRARHYKRFAFKVSCRSARAAANELSA